MEKVCHVADCDNNVNKFEDEVQGDCLLHHLKKIEYEMSKVMAHHLAMKLKLDEEMKIHKQTAKDLKSLKEKCKTDVAKRKTSSTEAHSVAPKKTKTETKAKPTLYDSSSTSSTDLLFKSKRNPKQKSDQKGKENSPNRRPNEEAPMTSLALLGPKEDKILKKSVSSPKIMKQQRLSFAAKTTKIIPSSSKATTSKTIVDDNETFCESQETLNPTWLSKSKTGVESLKKPSVSSKSFKEQAGITRPKKEELFNFVHQSTTKQDKLRNTSPPPKPIDPGETPDLTDVLRIKQEMISQAVVNAHNSSEDLFFEGSNSSSVVFYETVDDEPISVYSNTPHSEDITLRKLEQEFGEMTEFPEEVPEYLAKYRKGWRSVYYKECQDCIDYYKGLPTHTKAHVYKCLKLCSGFQLRTKDMQPPPPPCSPMKARPEDYTPDGFWNLRSQPTQTNEADDPDRTQDDL